MATEALSPRELGIGRLYWAMRDAVVVGDATTGRVVLWNPAAETVFGYSEAEALGMPLEQLVPPALRGAHLAGIAHYAATGHGRLIDSGQPFEVPALRKDGREVRIDLSLTPLQHPAGPYALAIIRDVTERHRAAEAALEASEARFQATFEQAAVGIAHVAPDGRWLRVNRRLAEIVGYSTAELLALRFQDITHPDDLESDLDLLRRMLAGEIDRYALEKRYLNKDGTAVWVNLTVALVRDAAGQPAYSISVVEDITARKSAEAEARGLYEAALALGGGLDLAERLEQVLDCVLDTVPADSVDIMLLTAAGDELQVVAARGGPGYARGYRQPRDAGLLGLALRERAPVRNGDVPGDPRTWDADVVRRSGVRSVVVAPLADGDDALGLLVARHPARDAFGAEDERRLAALAPLAAAAVRQSRLYEQAKEAVRARDEFLSIASHELKTPIAGIKGYAQNLLRARARGALDESRLDRSLRAIDAASDRLAALSNDLLDVSRLRLGRLPFEPRPVDLDALVGQVVLRFREHLDTEHGLHVSLSGAAPTVEVDPARLEQVLENLLDNAAKYSPGGGLIRVTLGEHDGGALVRVRDEGIGLPAACEEAIFEPFGRAPNASRSHIAGMGLGLHISRGIAAMHGGRLWAESAGEGLGTTVSLWLPPLPDGNSQG